MAAVDSRRISILHWVAKALGVTIYIDGLPYGCASGPEFREHVVVVEGRRYRMYSGPLTWPVDG